MGISDLKPITTNFLKELQDAYAGKKTSIRFIIHEISPTPIVKNDEIFESLVIGGTVAKVAIIKRTGIKIRVLSKKEVKHSFKSEGDFLDFVSTVLPENINLLALNFAYPLKPVFAGGKLDGILLAVSKEGKFHGLVGKKIGKEIEDYIFAKRKKRVIASVANDTICLLLSGLTKYSFDNLAAGIVGTGLNFAFFLNKNSLVNLESASFDKFTQTPEGIAIDRHSLLPGRGLFEKETAGAYLYKHFNIIIKDRKINYSPINSTEELNRISLNRGYSSSEVPTSRDESRSLNDDSSLRQLTDRTITNEVNHKTSEIAKHLLKRSAELAACQIAGITEFKKHDMVFNMEGSLFWKGNRYRQTVEQTVKRLVSEYNIEFVEIKDSGILGAAKLVS